MANATNTQVGRSVGHEWAFRGHQRAILLAAYGQFLLAIDSRIWDARSPNEPASIASAPITFACPTLRKLGSPPKTPRAAAGSSCANTLPSRCSSSMNNAKLRIARLMWSKELCEVHRYWALFIGLGSADRFA